MKVRVLALYEDNKDPSGKMKSARGMSWLLEFEDQRILFDVGMRGRILLHNLECLGLHPDDIDVLVLSHAHMDHTGGLPDFLRERSETKPIQIIAHPAILEKKRAARLKSIGLPNLDSELRRKIVLGFTNETFPINPFLF